MMFQIHNLINQSTKLPIRLKNKTANQVGMLIVGPSEGISLAFLSYKHTKQLLEVLALLMARLLEYRFREIFHCLYFFLAVVREGDRNKSYVGGIEFES